MLGPALSAVGFEDSTAIPAAEFERLSIDEAVKVWDTVANRTDSRISAFHFDWAKSDSENVPYYEAWSDVEAVRKKADPDDRCTASINDVLV